MMPKEPKLKKYCKIKIELFNLSFSINLFFVAPQIFFSILFIIQIEYNHYICFQNSFQVTKICSYTDGQ